MTLAKADPRVEIELDPTTMTRGGRGLAEGQVVPPLGVRHVPQAAGGARPAQGGRDLGVQAGLVRERTVGVRAYAKSHSTYPCDPTLEQLYDASDVRGLPRLGPAAGIGRRRAVHATAEVASPGQNPTGHPGISSQGPGGGPRSPLQQGVAGAQLKGD